MEYLTHRLSFEVDREGRLEATGDLLMPQSGGRGHQELPVDDLVAVAVVGKRADHVRSVVDRRDHAHSIGSSAAVRQDEYTLYGVTPAVPIRHRIHAGRTRKISARLQVNSILDQAAITRTS